MKRTSNDQINTKFYWDHIYTTPAKEQEYWTPTKRFSTALLYIKDGDKVMDLGCGVGALERMIKQNRNRCDIWGVDISQEVIENDKKHDPDIHYFQGEVGNLSPKIPNNYFDVVFSGETIEHLDKPNELFTDAYRLLRKGGILIITTPQDDHINSPEHVWYFEKDDIIKLFTTAGFSSPEFTNLPDMEHLMVFFAKGVK